MHTPRRLHAAFLIALACALVFGARAEARAASLSAPERATIGSTVEVTWQGPGAQYDPIYLVAPDAPDDAAALTKTAILSGKNPVSLPVPEQPGHYEIRYRSEGAVIARTPIEVVDVPTRLDAPESAPLGASIEIAWEGPGNSYEWIGLYETGAPDDAKPVAHATVLGRSPVAMHLPERPGDYELRYKTRVAKRTLATRPLTVESVETALEAPARGRTGETIEVHWRGPGNDYDQIALVALPAEEGAKAAAAAAILSRRNPVQLRLPDAEGDYELRYRTARGGEVLATRPFTIGGVETTLEAPERATSGRPLAVGWVGPGNDYDAIALYPAGAADDAPPTAEARILSGRNPVELRLPETEGPHELRYRTAQTATILARRAIVLEPAGRIAVRFEREGSVASGADAGATDTGVGAVEIVLDASGSMLKREDGTRRIEIARSVLEELVREHLGDDRDFALRVFGHREANACRTDLEIPLAPLDRDAVVTRVRAIEAMNLAKTPIADSLAKVPADLAGATGPRTVILITDGEETCDGDPAAVIEELRARGLDLRLSVVGFAIDDEELRRDFERWSELGGGGYFDARSAEELIASLRTVISGPFVVRDGAGEVVAEGVIGGAEVVVPAGTYTVETATRPPRVREGVEVKPRERTEVAF